MILAVLILLGRRSQYEEQVDDQTEMSEPVVERERTESVSSLGSIFATPGGSMQDTSKNVLNRAVNHQRKWEKQVREQRKNIYDDHTMLN